MKLEIIHIRKKIGNRGILNDISLTFESGHIYGIVGRNGAGKTMLFRAISGLMRTDSGKIILDGKELKKDFQVLPDTGIVIENAGLFPEKTGIENLEYLASFNHKIDGQSIRETIQKVGLDPDDKRTYGKYSLGMKQRLNIAQAIMEKPSVLLLDEPTNGLDEFGVEEIRQLILEEKERGAIVLLASHNKEDIQRLCDSIYRIENGRIRSEEEQ